MITVNNYFNEVERIGVNHLPDTLRKSHDFLTRSTGNGSNWDTYRNNDTIRRTVDLYLTKLNEFLSSQKERAPKEHVKPKKVKTAHRSAAEKKKAGTGDKPKKSAAETKTASKKVAHIREEVKFIKRYVGLHNKVKSPNAVLNLIKGLQRSIVQKLIRKTSPLAKEIQLIQDKLVSMYNSMKGDLLVQINDKDLSRLVAIAGGEEVYPSINIIKRFIGMQGKEFDDKKTGLFLKQIDNALQRKKVTTDDPYLDKVKSIQKVLRKFEAGDRIAVSKAELNGLEGIIKACGCKTDLGRIYHTNGKNLRRCKKKTYSDAGKGACSHNKGLSGVLTAEELANRQFNTLDFLVPWVLLIGKPATNFTMMLHGEPGAGKTTFLLKFARYLAENFGKVLYISSEEFAAATLTKKVNELLNPFPLNLHFAEKLSEVDLSDYQFVILDSINDLGLRLADYKAMREAHPHVAFILILQHTKDGQFRGGKDWEHTVEIAGKVENGVISIYRNRYGVKGMLDFFDEGATYKNEPKPYSTDTYIN